MERIGCFWGHATTAIPGQIETGKVLEAEEEALLFYSSVLPDAVSRIKGSQDQIEQRRDKAVEREREREGAGSSKGMSGGAE